QRDGGRDGKAIVSHGVRKLQSTQESARKAIDASSLPIDPAAQPFGDEIRHADSGGVALALIVEIEQHDGLDRHIRFASMPAMHPYDVRIHAGAGNILASLPHN